MDSSLEVESDEVKPKVEQSLLEKSLRHPMEDEV